MVWKQNSVNNILLMRFSNTSHDIGPCTQGCFKSLMRLCTKPEANSSVKHLTSEGVEAGAVACNSCGSSRTERSTTSKSLWKDGSEWPLMLASDTMPVWFSTAFHWRSDQWIIMRCNYWRADTQWLFMQAMRNCIWRFSSPTFLKPDDMTIKNVCGSNGDDIYDQDQVDHTTFHSQGTHNNTDNWKNSKSFPDSESTCSQTLSPPTDWELDLAVRGNLRPKFQ